MDKLKTLVDPKDPAFQKNVEHNRKLLEEYRALAEKTKLGGSEKVRQLHQSRNKLLVRDRLEELLDPDTPFLELSLLAARDVYPPDSPPAAGLVTGVGVIHGREVMVIANDATVKGGTYYPLTVKKHLRAQEIALENKLPCLYLVDSGGAFLPLQDQVFPDKEHFGRI
ncbi:MAG: methylcrotonoyl-CoA carboxylase, partial [Elusimicrobia bacterium]|nr:methylcrotonoyl-CoA carboxylase [Elusimicrobiota bacterium]